MMMMLYIELKGVRRKGRPRKLWLEIRVDHGSKHLESRCKKYERENGQRFTWTGQLPGKYYICNVNILFF